MPAVWRLQLDTFKRIFLPFQGLKMESALQKIKTESLERKRILKKSKIIGLKSTALINKRKKKKKAKAQKSAWNYESAAVFLTSK